MNLYNSIVQSYYIILEMYHLESIWSFLKFKNIFKKISFTPPNSQIPIVSLDPPFPFPNPPLLTPNNRHGNRQSQFLFMILKVRTEGWEVFVLFLLILLLQK